MNVNVTRLLLHVGLISVGVVVADDPVISPLPDPVKGFALLAGFDYGPVVAVGDVVGYASRCVGRRRRHLVGKPGVLRRKGRIWIEVLHAIFDFIVGKIPCQCYKKDVITKKRNVTMLLLQNSALIQNSAQR
jgi:hypothetical protein